MPLLVVVNDLSASQPAESIVDANRLLREFSDLLTDGRLNGPKVLVTPPWFLGVQLCVGYLNMANARSRLHLRRRKLGNVQRPSTFTMMVAGVHKRWLFRAPE